MERLGQWAVVTGASSGIGAVYATELARQGYAVLAVARRRERLVALADAIASAGGPGRIEPLVADLETQEGIDAVVKRAHELDALGLVVNCAGFAEHGAFLELPAARSAAQVALNIDALVQLTRALLPQLVARRQGAVVNVASGMAFQSVPWFGVYAATKAFVLSFSDALSYELRGTGVQVQALCPGVTRTEFGAVPSVERVLRRLPSQSPEAVVHASLRGLARRRVVVTVGWFTQLTKVLARITPSWLNRMISGALMRPLPEPALTAR